MATKTVTYTPSASNYYNSENTSGGSGFYFGKNRKCRLTINMNTLKSYLEGYDLVSATFSVNLGSSHWNEKDDIYLGVHTSSSVNTVFPNQTRSGATWKGVQSSSKALYPANSTISMGATTPINYALSKYSGNFYLWVYDTHASTSDSFAASGWKLTLKLQEKEPEPVSKINYNDNGVWKIGTPYVLDNGNWKQGRAYVLNDGIWMPS